MLEDQLQDAAQSGHEAAYTLLLKDPAFNRLVGCMATMYVVYNNKGQRNIDQRSFQLAKQEVQTFCARSSGYSAKLSRDTRNGRWNRGAIHSSEGEQGWQGKGDVERLGRRGGGVRSAEQAAPDSAAANPAAVEAPLIHDKSRCPTCRCRTSRVWKLQHGANSAVVCPACVKRVARSWKDTTHG